MEILIIIGAIQALFFSLLVFSKKQRSKADTILGVWLITMFVMLFCPYVAFRYPEKYYHLAEVGAFLFPLLSIWAFIYTKTLTNGNFKTKWLLHFFPLLVVGGAFLPLVLGDQYNLESLRSQIVVSRQLIIAVLTNFFVYTSYSVASLILLRTHKRSIRFKFSYEKNIDLRWLQHLIISLQVISFLIILLTTLFFTNQIPVLDVDLYLYIIVSIYIFFIGFWGFKQGKIFHYSAISSSGEPKAVNEQGIEKSRSEDEQFAEKLHHYMISDQVYLNPKLSLYDLSSSMNISTQKLSSHLNRFQKINFYEYVNRYRIQEVQNRLNDNNKRFTVLSIAYDCGFNSKASFNITFKQTTGLTPTEYVNR